MPQFEVQCEDVVFGCDAGTQAELPADQVAAVAAEWTKANNAFPEGVRGILAASISVDDSVYEGGEDEDGDVKAFVTVTLLVEAEDKEAAEYMETPDALLAFVAAKLCEGIEFEGNWEVVETCEYEAAP